jgi:hypothetical protein
MSNIYLSKEEKKKIVTTIQRGEKVSKQIDSFEKKVSQERDKNLAIIRNFEAKTS